MTFEEICIQRYGAGAPDEPAFPDLIGMRASTHPFVALMTSVLEDVVADRIEPDEKPYIAAIETFRADLEACEDPITYLDFGAASKYAEQTAEEMYRGVERSRSIGNLCRRSSKPYRAALMLLKLLRRTRPRVCLELGSGLGLSAAYQAAALELNGTGRLFTLEGAAPLADIARETLSRFGHDRAVIEVGRWQDTLGGVLAANRPIDFAFIDGHHDRDASIGYFETILPALSDGAIFILDDIRWSDGMLEAWTRIKSDARIDVSVDLVDTGICRIAESAPAGEHHRLT